MKKVVMDVLPPISNVIMKINAQNCLANARTRLYKEYNEV